MCRLARLALLISLTSPFLSLPTRADESAIKDLREELPPDHVELENGRRYEGRILAEDNDEVVLLMGSRAKSYARDKVTEVRSAHRNLRDALYELDRTPADELVARSELAQRWEASGLALEAQLLWWEILIHDPDHTEAHEQLGHRQRNGKWRRKVGTSWISVADLDQHHADFSEARWLATTHFTVRTNMNLQQSLQVTWMFERCYATFYEVFGQELGLYHSVQPLMTYLYATPDDFPELTGKRSYYSPADERAFIGWWSEPHKTAVHEVTHQMLHGAALALGNRAEIPGWLDEGLAQYMAHAVNPEGSWVERQGDRAGYSADLFRYHLGSETEYGLKRVLNFKSGDFHGASSHYEKYALSYTLTHYLLHADGRTHRPGFVKFIRGAIHEGKASATHFKKALGIKKEKGFEEAWNTYVASMGRQ